MNSTTNDVTDHASWVTDVTTMTAETPGGNGGAPPTEYIETEIANFIRKYLQFSICLFGIHGNLVAMAVLVQRQMRRKTTYMYMLVISVADTTTLINAAMWWIQGRGYYNFNSVWYCKLSLFTFFMAIHTSVGCLVAMTIERYLVVRFPLKAKSWITRKRALLAIFGVIVLMLAINLQNIWTRTMVTLPSGSTLCLFSSVAKASSKYGYFHLKVWPWIDATTYSFLPLLTLIVLNVLIIRTISASARSTRSADQPEKRSRSQMYTERQVTMMLLSLTSTFIVLTGPMAVFLIVEKVWDYESYPHQVARWKLVRSVVSNLMYVNHAINVLVYCTTGTAFRRQLKVMVSCGTTDNASGMSVVTMTTCTSSVASVITKTSLTQSTASVAESSLSNTGVTTADSQM